MRSKGEGIFGSALKKKWECLRAGVLGSRFEELECEGAAVLRSESVREREY